MNFTQALHVFGLLRPVTKPVLKVLRGGAAKEAFAAGDESRMREINLAFEILTGKTEAAFDDMTGHPEGPSGLVRAQCREQAGQAYILDWRMHPRAGKGGADKVVIDNPQRVSWDEELGCFQLVGAGGSAKPYYGEARTQEAGSSEPFAQGWTSLFKAQVGFGTITCPCCSATNLQWCEGCGTIFCHRNRADYPTGNYTCPSCKKEYTWNGVGKPIETVFDGKQLRSLTKLASGGALGQDIAKQLAHNAED